MCAYHAIVLPAVYVLGPVTVSDRLGGPGVLFLSQPLVPTGDSLLVSLMRNSIDCFPIHYRGHHLHVRVSGKGAEVSVDPRDVPPVAIECRGRVEQLAPGCTIRFPSVPSD